MADFDPFEAGGYVTPSQPPQGAPPIDDPFAAGGYASLPERKTEAAGPQPKLTGVTEFGQPIYDDDALNRQMRTAEIRPVEKMGEGLTFGMLPHVVAGARSLAGTPYAQGLQESRDFTNQTSAEHPLASVLAEGAGSAIPMLLSGGATAPETAAGFLPRFIQSARLGAGLGGASEIGHDIGQGKMDNFVPDVLTGAAAGGLAGAAGPILGQGVQAASNMVRGGISGIRNAFTDAGQRGVAGQVLREFSGGPPAYVAQSPIPGLELRAPQATGNRGLALLENTLASEPGLQRGIAPGETVSGNRTPDQVNAIAHSLVGSDAAMEPSALTNQASQRGVDAIHGVNDSLREVERTLWQHPAISGPILNSRALTAGVAGDVAMMPAGFRNQIMGTNAPLASYMQELHELPQNASIHDLNAIRSNVLQVGRDARSGLNPDSKLATAAERLGDSILNRIGVDPSIAGASGTPSGKAWEAYQTARDFTRQRAQALGYDEFGRILNPNASGNNAGKGETQFGAFFDPSKGTSSGLMRLQTAANLARAAGATSQADALESASRDYMKAKVLEQARRGTGVDVTGRPSLSLPMMDTTVNKAMPSVNEVPMMRPIAQDLQAAGNAAELVNRPTMTRGDANSTTYEKLRSNDLIGSIIGQSGSSALGAAAGGYAGYEHGPEAVPWWARVPLGMAAGAAAGNRIGPSVGKFLTHYVPGIAEGPRNAIQRHLWEALASQNAYEQALRAPMMTGPAVSSPGAFSSAIPQAARMLIPPVTGEAAR